MAAYISELNYLGGIDSDFVEVVLPAGTDPTGWMLVAYDKAGNAEQRFKFDSPVSSSGGNDVYLFDGLIPYWIDLKMEESLALVAPDGTVVQYIGFDGATTALNGPAAGMTTQVVGLQDKSSQSMVTSDEGVSYQSTRQSTPGTVPCFAPGTLIDTPDGPCPVERLRPGDRVLTLDAGAQPLVWVGRRAQALAGLPADRRPVLIRAGALARGRPAADLVVSPQHRVLVGETGQLAALFDRPALVAAKALTGLPGIRHMGGRSAAVWHHVACARHQILFAAGCATETLLPGPMVLAGARTRDLPVLMALDPAPARPLLAVGTARAAIRAARSCAGRAPAMVQTA